MLSSNFHIARYARFYRLTKFAKIDRDAAKKVLSICIEKFGYDGKRPYCKMLDDITKAIAQARQEGRDERALSE